MNYRVVWEIDIEANSPEEAARQALEIQRDPGSTAHVFDTWDEGGNHKPVDLSENEND